MKFISVKIFDAEPISLGEYNTHRGWDIPADENPEQRGYIVKDQDGRESWVPKENFEKQAFPMLESDGSKVTETMVNEFMGGIETRKIGDRSTLVTVETATGFVQHEASSCVDPKNYDHELGAKIATNNIKNDIWKLLGFVLQWGKNGISNKNTKESLESEEN